MPREPQEPYEKARSTTGGEPPGQKVSNMLLRKIGGQLLIAPERMPEVTEHAHFADKGPYSQNYGFSSSHARPERRLSTKELKLSNCGAGEDS